MKSTLRRRAFLLSGLTAAATFGATTPAAGAQSAETVTLWKLSADWGYPAGPKGKTRCKGRACHSHAANKLYLSAAHATAGRTHKCCVAQPYPIEIPAATYERLTALPPATGAALADLRRPDVAAVIADTTDARPPGGTTGPPQEALTQRPTEPHDVAAQGARLPRELAATGSSVELAAVAGGLAAMGTLVTLATRRRATAPAGPEEAHVE